MRTSTSFLLLETLEWDLMSVLPFLSLCTTIWSWIICGDQPFMHLHEFQSLRFTSWLSNFIFKGQNRILTRYLVPTLLSKPHYFSCRVFNDLTLGKMSLQLVAKISHLIEKCLQLCIVAYVLLVHIAAYCSLPLILLSLWFYPSFRVVFLAYMCWFYYSSHLAFGTSKK